MSRTMNMLCTALLLGYVPLATPAVELVLDSVTANQAGRELPLRVGGRASFDLDPEAGVLTAAGTWTATNQPSSQYSRFTHQVEDMRAGADGELSMRSYECVEGTLGAELLAQNYCGRYGFGANMTDDGGAVDDESKGTPISLAGWMVGAFDWDGQSLVVVLVADDPATDSLELRFSVKPPR